MQIELQRSAKTARPVYRQIADRIRDDVAAGRLGAGERLPPIRTLARQLGVNRDTVALAYEALAADGVVESTVGRGTFVCAVPSAGAPISLRLSPSVERLLDFERARHRYASEGDPVPLHAIVPDAALYPVEAFRRALNRVLAREGPELLLYGAPLGHEGLREVLGERLRASGIDVSAEEIVLCQGASQGISLAMRLFAESGDAVAVEDPTYGNVLAALASLGLRAAPVPMTAEGLDLDVLERTLARPEVRLLYTIPTFHNPMGVTTNLAHRRRLLEIAGRAGKPIVEDGYEMDLRYAGRAVAPLAALDPDGLVVHLFSFSKSLFPGGRVGSLTARGRVRDALLALRGATDLGGSLLLQAALADFVRGGDYERHLARLRRVLRARRAALFEALEQEMPEDVSWTRPEGGYQIWLELPEAVDARNLVTETERAGVRIAPGGQFHPDGRPSRGIRLSIALADEPAIRRGVAALATALRACIAAGPAPARAAGLTL